MNINELYKYHADFVSRKFPEIRDYRGPLRHLKKEVDEAIESGEEEEFSDILLLLFSSYRLRFPNNSPDDLLKAAYLKLTACEGREWGKMNKEGFQEHIR